MFYHVIISAKYLSTSSVKFMSQRVSINRLKIGDYIMIDDHACIIVDLAFAGMRFKSKIYVAGRDFTTNEKYEKIYMLYDSQRNFNHVLVPSIDDFIPTIK